MDSSTTTARAGPLVKLKLQKLWEFISTELSPTAKSSSPLIWVILAFISVNYIFSPLGWDQQVNVAFAQQADIVGTFPQNIVEAWTIRGIGYKLLVYIFYSISTLFVDYENKILFESVFRLCMFLFFVGGSLLSVWLSRARLREYDFDVRTVGFLIAASFLTLSHWVAFQAEDVAAMVAIIGISLGVSDLKYSHYLAGIVLALTITLKGITVLLAPLGVLMIIIFDGKLAQKHIKIILSGLTTGVILAISIYFLAPSIVIDLIEATLFQSTFSTSIRGRLYALAVFAKYFVHLPILLPTAALGIIILSKKIADREILQSISVMTLAILPLLNVIIQSKGFAYHFALLIPTAIGLVLWTSYELDQDLPINLSSIAIIMFLLVSVMTVTPLAVVNESSPGSWQKDTTYAANSYQEIEDEFGITEKDEILYLSGGTPTYHLEAESALRYYYPLPLQRSNPELRQSELFSQTYSQAMDFRGQYIVVDHGWFSFNHLPKLSDKLDEEYCAIADPKGPRVEDIVIYERIDEEEMQNCD